MKTLLITALLMLSSLSTKAETTKIDTLSVWRDRTRVCTVKYYVHKDTLFTDKKFKHIAFIFSENKTNKMILMQESLFFSQDPKNGWYFTVLDKNKVTQPEHSYLSAVVLRDCLWNVQEDRHRWANGYMFNISREMKYTRPKKSKNFNRIIKQLNFSTK